MTKKERIMKRLHEHYQVVLDKGYETIGIFLQGSQNYGLDYEDSDIDTKVIVLPKFNDFLMNKKPVSTTLVLENDEHIDLKDIRLMFDCFRKQNINFVEILFTEYKILNPKYKAIFNQLIKNNEYIARYNTFAAVNCMAGMSYEKYKALEHPYPAIMDKIEKFKYDPKQLHHIIRINEFIDRYANDVCYKDCLISEHKERLIEIKKGFYTLDEAREVAQSMVGDTRFVKDRYMEENEPKTDKGVDELLNSVLLDIMKLNFKSELEIL